MSATERRQGLRTTLQKLAYIHIEPDNGGIVLNVSDDGLAFHAMAPVEKNGELRFFLKEQNRRIDVCGELIWTDDIQKIGGLRFTALTSEARDQITDWISRSEEPTDGGGSRLGAAFLRAFPRLKVRNLVPRIEARDRIRPLKTKVRLKMSGFSGGLATGLLISLLAALIFVFSYTHRQQLGESLIHVGERLVSKSPAQPTAPQTQSTTSPRQSPLALTQQPSASFVVTPQKARVATLPTPAVRTPAPAEHKPKADEAPFQDVVKILPVPRNTAEKTQLNTRDAQRSSPKESPRANATVSAQHISPPNTGTIASTAAASTAVATFSLPSKPAAAPDNTPSQSGPSGQVQAENVGSFPALPTQRFFDLGKFKQQQSAQDLSDRVAQLGMRSSVVNKGHLWMSSYQVLVGPYLTESEESKIHGDLISNGIKARPFERGSRGFSFRSALTLGGSKLPVGELNIAWETYVSEAKVNFVQGGSVLASANGSWVSRPQKFAHNEYVYENSGGNSRPLLELHFAGLDRALVFR